MKQVLIYIALLALFAQCNSKKQLPESNGSPSKAIIVMNTELWDGAVGDTLKKVFQSPYPGLPQDEPSFDISPMSPFDMGDIVKKFRTLVFVIILDDDSPQGKQLAGFVGQDMKQSVTEDKDALLYIEYDKFAKNQTVAFLIAPTREALLNRLIAQQQLVLSNINAGENRVMQNRISDDQNEDLVDSIFVEQSFQMSIPKAMRLEMEKENFLWFRNPDVIEDENVFITKRTFNGSIDELTTAYAIALRDSISKLHLYGSSDSSSFMAIQDIMPIKLRKVNDFSGTTALEFRGLWKLNNNSRGGPFISYLLVDKAKRELYYIEGFVAAPAVKKRNFIRRLQAILSTFQLKN